MRLAKFSKSFVKTKNWLVSVTWKVKLECWFGKSVPLSCEHTYLSIFQWGPNKVFHLFGPETLHSGLCFYCCCSCKLLHFVILWKLEEKNTKGKDPQQRNFYISSPSSLVKSLSCFAAAIAVNVVVFFPCTVFNCLHMSQ